MIHTGTAPLHGFFINPKVTLGVFAVGAEDWIFDALIGADIGYQFVVGPFYFAFILGVSGGLGWGVDTDDVAGPLNDLGGIFKAPDFRPVLGLNLQQFRAGFVF